MKTLYINAKCSDLCFLSFYNDESGNTFERDGYVPSGLGIGEFGGDYIEMVIDADTGQIQGWKPLDSIDVVKRGFKKV
jgi:hypothetical protein